MLSRKSCHHVLLCEKHLFPTTSLSRWSNKCVSLPMLRVHSWQILSTQKQKFQLSLRSPALLQISEMAFKFSSASQHFNNSSLFSLATALCLTLIKTYSFYLLSAEKATQKTNIKVFTKGLWFIAWYETISHFSPLLQGNISRPIHIPVLSSIMLPNLMNTSYRKIVQFFRIMPDIF